MQLKPGSTSRFRVFHGLTGFVSRRDRRRLVRGATITKRPANARKKPRPKSGLGAHFCSQVSATRLALSGHQVSVVIGTCGFAMFTDQSLPGIRLPALPPSFSCAVETGTPPLGNTLHSPYHGLSDTKCFLVEVRGFEPLSDTRQIQRDYND